MERRRGAGVQTRVKARAYNTTRSRLKAGGPHPPGRGAEFHSAAGPQAQRPTLQGQKPTAGAG